jgi:putative transposase
MVTYRRYYVPGGTYFFTLTLADRRSALLCEHVDRLRQSFKEVREEKPFKVIAMVVLPDHMHALWRLPENDADYSGRWKSIKSRFTRALVRQGIQFSRTAKGEYRVWQRRFWEHTIRDQDDLNRHVDYIHYNPVKHGLVARACDWPYSSIHRYVRKGILSADWGSDRIDEEGQGQSYGE